MQETCVTVLKYTSPITTNKSYMAFIPAVLVAAGIAILSLMEQTHAPRIVVNDKLMHGFMYAVLGISLILPLLRTSNPLNSKPLTRYIGTFVGVTMYGVLMEALQRFCTLTRSGEMADIYADALGALLALLFVAVLRWLWHKKKMTNDQ